MEDLLIEVLHSFGYPVIQQGSMLPDEEYPETFLPFGTMIHRIAVIMTTGRIVLYGITM